MNETSLPDALDVVSFIAAGSRFAVEANQVRTQLSAAHCATATRVEQALGLPADEASGMYSRRILLVKGLAGDTTLAVSEPVELRSLRVDTIYPLPPLIAARNTLVGIRGLAMENDGITILVDLSAKKPAI